ncbi:hypothetical protein HYDPIDRAFT_27117 [Hydnomerulius pinastri MD-312]|nr:hypothetical protein HYDPIDRAFT_27117 [Hydnomerulius pinastri MD-312]
MTASSKARIRRAAWLAFGLVALAAFSASAQPTTAHSVQSKPEVTPKLGVHNARETLLPHHAQADVDQAAEAARAFRSAILTLSNLTAHPPPYAQDPFAQPSTSQSSSFFSSFLPSAQGQGPFSSAIRVALKLRQQLSPFQIFSSSDGMGAGSRKDEEMRGKAIKVVDLLQHSAELGNMEALYTLAQVSLFPPNIYFPSDPKLAYSSFSTHAALTGNATSQAHLAFFHATGYADAVPLDQAKALLYYTFAAQGGHKGAQMSLAYRYWSGISTLEDCSRAVEWYEAAADQAMEMFLSGPPGGLTLPYTPTRLSDLDGGVYGPGASVASTGLNVIKPAVKAGFAQAAGETWEDLLEYYMFNADRGEMDFAYKLGKIFYQGSIYAAAGGIGSGSEGVGRIGEDFKVAQSYFLQIARQVWPRDPVNPLQHNSPSYKAEGVTQPGWAPKSAAYLGRMYMRGEGVKQDFEMAMMWFERGAEYGDRECHNGLGILWRDGLVKGRKDIQKALEFFSHAAGLELAEAYVNLGKYYYGRGEFKPAVTYFEIAVRFGSTFEAHFYLAKIHTMNMRSTGLPQDYAAGSCASAVSFYKLVSERGVWDDDLVDDAEFAWNSGTERGKEMAILMWWIAAERGSEIAQNNLAYVLDQDRSVLRLTRFSPIEASNDTARLALTQWTRSASQRNVDALVKVGDYYYHGLGVPDEPQSLRWEKAAKYYQSAADTQLSALAMWNLGWMYENGVGVPQDYHLAKRHYDQALETNSEAYLPVLLSLVKLYARSLWHTLQGGQNGLDLWNYDEDKLSVSERANLKREIDSAAQADSESSEGEYGTSQEEISEEFEEDGPWYIGKAKEEFHRRRRGEAARRVEEEDDPVQWARDRRNAENERDSDFGPEDYFDAALRGGHRGDEEDEFAETMLLVALCLAVGVLIYIRTRLVHRARRNHDEQQPEQPRQNLVMFGSVTPGVVELLFHYPYLLSKPTSSPSLRPTVPLVLLAKLANDAERLTEYCDLDNASITDSLNRSLHSFSTITRCTMAFDLQALEEPITRILSAPGVDLGTISAKRVRKALLEDPINAPLGLTAEGLKERRGEVDQVISRIFESVSRAAADDGAKRKREDEEDEADGADEQADASEDAGEVEEAKPPKKKGKKTVEQSDAELARKLSSEINSRSRRGPSNTAASSPKKAKRKPKKSAATVNSEDEHDADDAVVKKKRGGAKGGFAKEYTLSGPLSTVVGVDRLSRPQVVKKLWEYIHGHELQNPSNKKEIICDDAFRAVFAVDKIDMFRMNKVLGQHLHEE